MGAEKGRVADALASELSALGAKDCFMVTGGGAMHLNDAFGKCGMKVWCLHHEQSCAIAAEACARVSGAPAVVNVTTGPGGINALNGVFGAFADSVPMIVVSGQVKSSTMRSASAVPLRQLGDQEGPAEELARAVCKAAVTLRDGRLARECARQAWALASSGRPGPVWIDVPLDVQGMPEPEQERGELGWLMHESAGNEAGAAQGERLEGLARECALMLAGASRPLILMGQGARISGIAREVLEFAEERKIAVCGGWGAYDLVPDGHPCAAGRPGTVGDRMGNLAAQSADAVLVLGSRLNIRQVSYAWENFAKGARVAQVDIDRGELEKPTSPQGLKAHAELGAFWRAFGQEQQSADWEACKAARHGWMERLGRMRLGVPTPVEDSRKAPRLGEGSGLNPYELCRELSERFAPGQIVVVGNGTVSVAGMQASEMKQGQRWIANSGCASMGYDLPAAFGAWVGSGCEAEVVCYAGDGSAMMNLQDWASWAQFGARIRCVVFDNGGYHSIRQTQMAYFSQSPVGYDAQTGIAFPELEKVAAALGVASAKIGADMGPREAADAVMALPAPCVARALIDPGVPFAPKLASRKLDDGRMLSPSLEDMWPFMEPGELDKWMKDGLD